MPVSLVARKAGPSGRPAVFPNLPAIRRRVPRLLVNVVRALSTRRNSPARAVPSRCLGLCACSNMDCPVRAVRAVLAVIPDKWNLNPGSCPRGFIEHIRPKGESSIRSNNMLYLHTLGVYVILCTLFRREPRCNQQGDVSLASGTRLRTLCTLGLRPGLTSKPVYSLGIKPGHALTTPHIPQRTSGSHEVSHHGLSGTGTTLSNVCIMTSIMARTVIILVQSTSGVKGISLFPLTC